MNSLEDNVCVITGASEGIGRALALEFAARGAKLALAARNSDRLESVASQCRELGGEALVCAADVSVEADCAQLIERTVDHFGRLDTLVNNAGVTMWSRFEDVTDSSVFEYLMRVNYLGAVYPTRHALPHLRASAGRLVGVASVAGLTGVPERTGYAASKHALFGFFESLRIELRGSGVSVTMIAPDFVQSQIHKRALDGDGRALGETPLQRDKIMTAETCARLTVDAIARRRRILITSLRGRAGRWLRLVAPSLIDSIAARAIEKGR